MEPINPTVTFPDYPGMKLPVSTVSYPILRWYLNACGSNVELAAQVLDSYLAIVYMLTCHSLIEEETPQQRFEETTASWEHVVEMMYRHVPQLTREAVSGIAAIFREVMEVAREVDDIEALRPLLEWASYRGYTLPGYAAFVFEVLRMQESTFFNTVIQFWLLNRRSDHNRTLGQNEEEWEDFEPAELTDVGFEPSGPRLDVDNIAITTRYLKNPTCSTCRNESATEDECGHSTCSICLDRLDLDATDQNKTPMKVRCGHAHSFHFECLDDLINGISEFSNLCPNCRVPICERRDRRAIATDTLISDRVDAALAAEDSSSEESENQEMIGVEEEEKEDEMTGID